MLGGAGLNGEGEAVDELAQLLGGNVGMGVEGGKYGAWGQWCSVGDGGPGGRSWERSGGCGLGRLVGEVDGVRGHGAFDRSFLPLGCVIDAKRREESKRREVEGVDWGVQFDSVLALTFLWLLCSRGCLR